MAGWPLQKHPFIPDNDMNLPQPTESKKELTYVVPNILLKYEQSNGLPLAQVRMGGAKQIEYITTVEYLDSPVDESNQLFVIKAKNKINVAGVILDVLNDQITGDKPIAPSSPTASEYMSKVGTPVLTYFSCRHDPATSVGVERPVYRTVRARIVLP